MPEVKKLLSVATEDEKMDFYKQAKGEYAGKPFYYGLAKTAERLSEKEEEMVEVVTWACHGGFNAMEYNTLCLLNSKLNHKFFCSIIIIII